jgi:orotate phosphoribosyltransferase
MGARSLTIVELSSKLFLMHDNSLPVMSPRRGHFLYESGHHGDQWFDLELLCLRPVALRPYITQLAKLVEPYRPEIVCGALVEGAYVGLLVANELGCEFVYALRESSVVGRQSSGKQSSVAARQLFPIEYRIPDTLHAAVKAKRVAIVNDMINAGSAVRGAYLHLVELGADVVVVASLMVRGAGFEPFAAEHGLNVETLSQFAAKLWTPEECPLCQRGEKLESLANA